MTIDERLDRIEHITAGLAEERIKDREENRQLWRDSQRQINELAVRMNELTLKMADTNDAITRLAEESRARMDRLEEEMRAADLKLGERIEALVSAIGRALPRN